ncbi:MAG: polyphosphate kinase 1 [Clostridia bacterium]|nr:polyphosphate kinase 1 [Clostridia bacterium]
MGAHMRRIEREAMENRELSWLRFNSRIVDEADDPANPLLERAKFLAIVTSNMDEFLQVRYHGIYQNRESDEKGLGGVDGEKLYRKVNKAILRQCNRQYTLYEGVRSELYLKGVRLFPTFPLDDVMSEREKVLFEREISPYLKVEDLIADRVQQKKLYLCVKLVRGRRKAAQFKMVALPTSLPRLFDLTPETEMQNLIRLEDIIKHYAYRLFPREEVEHAAMFRVLRNQNFPVTEETRADVVPAVREMLGKRVSGAVMRLEAEERMSEEMLTLLMKIFKVEQERRYRVTGPLDLNKMLMSLYSMVKRPELKYENVKPLPIPELMGEDVFEKIDERDWLMYHPYHSFDPVVHLMQRAAEDPAVRTIKQTLYRVSGNSPIVAALAKAAENGKKVVVLFEAHARFDELNNLLWGDKLERAGCRVLYGLPNLKVHSKVTLFERWVDGERRRTVHLGTGNYHDGTAKLYTDFGLLTSDRQLTQDAANFFEVLEGREGALVEIMKAPDMMRNKLIQLIRREQKNAEAGLPARVLAKMNSLSDKKVIQALAEASQAGVEVDLIVRGICCVLPAVEGFTEKVHVRSIVGRHLEHARAFMFENGGNHEVYLASADWMPRNLSKRAELMFPIKDEACRQAVENVLTLQWNDTQKCRHRNPDGSDELVPLRNGGLNAQEVLLKDVNGVFAGTVPLQLELQEEVVPEDIASI